MSKLQEDALVQWYPGTRPGHIEKLCQAGDPNGPVGAVVGRDETGIVFVIVGPGGKQTRGTAKTVQAAKEEVMRRLGAQEIKKT